MLIKDSEYIAIHDGVRPLVSEETIRKAFADAEVFGNAVPVIPVNESVRKEEAGTNTPVRGIPYTLYKRPRYLKQT